MLNRRKPKKIKILLALGFKLQVTPLSVLRMDFLLKYLFYPCFLKSFYMKISLRAKFDTSRECNSKKPRSKLLNQTKCMHSPSLAWYGLKYFHQVLFCLSSVFHCFVLCISSIDDSARCKSPSRYSSATRIKSLNRQAS